jgi:glucosamine-6-phosphate deaminase
MVYGEVTDDVPASILQLHPDITIMVDEAAAGKLNMESNQLIF